MKGKHTRFIKVTIATIAVLVTVKLMAQACFKLEPVYCPGSVDGVLGSTCVLDASVNAGEYLIPNSDAEPGSFQTYCPVLSCYYHCPDGDSYGGPPSAQGNEFCNSDFGLPCP